MAIKLSHGKIMTVFNEYLDADTNKSFAAFCQEKQYFPSLNSDYKIDHLADSSVLSLVDKKFGQQKRKLESIMTFIAAKPDLFDETTIVAVKRQAFNFCEKYDFNLKLSDDTNNFFKQHHFLQINRRKRHGGAKSFGKKALIPAAITAVITGAISAGIVAAASTTGSSLLISTAPWLDVIDHFVLGAAAGFVATPIYMKTSKHIVRNYYKKKGTKGSNFTQLDNAQVQTLQDVKNLDLPIEDLLNDIKNKYAEITELRMLGTNPFLHPIRAFKKYWLTKRSRDAMHEVVAFRNMLNQEISIAEALILNENQNPNENSSTVTAAQNAKIQKYTLLQSLISEHLDSIDSKVVLSMMDDQGSKRAKKKHLYEYSDILAKSELTQDGIITNDYNVDKRVYAMLERRINARFTSGTESLDETALEQQAKQKAKQKQEKQERKQMLDDIAMRAEQSLLALEQSGELDRVVTESGVSRAVVDKILELIHSQQYTTKGKAKANARSLALGKNGKLLSETLVDGESIQQPYIQLIRYINSTTTVAKKQTAKTTVNTDSDGDTATAGSIGIVSDNDPTAILP